MYPNPITGKWHFGPDYVPYFYASGRFLSYDLPHARAPLEVRFVPAASYDFTSDLLESRAYPVPQTVEQVIRSGYLAIPKSVVRSAQLGTRNCAQKGATWVINSSVCYDAVNKILSAHP